MVALSDLIIERARDYPDRPAIVSADGKIILYRDVLPELAIGNQVHYTSGTTGIQKKFTITDDNLSRRLKRLIIVRPELERIDRLFVPVSHLSALYNQLKTYLLLNGKTLFDIGLDSRPDSWLKMCRDHDVQGVCFIPKLPQLHIMIDWGFRFQHAFISGSTASKELLNRILVGLSEHASVAYAASEVGQVAGAPVEDIIEIPNCVGRIAPDLGLRIENGSIKISCDTMVGGYIDAEEETNRNFQVGWFSTGDKGRFVDGFLVVDGRES